MGWPLTGNNLSRFNRLLDDLRQYGDFPFVGSPDDITWLWQIIREASDNQLNPALDDVANRSHYWMLRLVAFLGDQVTPPAPAPPTGLLWGPNPSIIDMSVDGRNLDFSFLDNPSITSLDFRGLTLITDGGSGNGLNLYTPNSVGMNFSFPDLENVDAPFGFGGEGTIGSISAPKLKNVQFGMFLYGNPITSLDFPGLETVVEGGLDVVDDVPLTSMSWPALRTVGVGSVGGVTYYAAYSCPNLTTLLHPALEQVDSDLVVFGCPLLTALDFPSLVSARISVADCVSLVSLSVPLWGTLSASNAGFTLVNTGLISLVLPSLVEATQGSVDVHNNLFLDSISLPLYVGNDAPSANLAFYNNPVLTTLSLPSWSPADGSGLLFSGNSLSASSVNHVLARAVANLAYVSGSIDLSGQTPAQPPTGQGATDKTTLQGRGVTVITD